MKLSFSQCSLLSSVKNGDLSQVTQLIEELSKCVSNFISMHSKLDCQFRQQLYTFTFSYIIQSLQGQNIHIPINEQDCPQNVIIEIIQGIKQFKTDLFDLAAQNPNLPLFDFLVSQQFNDLYDVLTASERQLNQQLEPLTPTKKQNILSTKPSYYYNDQIKIRSSSVGHICSNKQLQQNELELDFSLLKQFVYDQIEQKQIIEQSPKAKNKINPQLFSFDSTFVKDLPLSRFNATSNYDDNQFNFTLQKDALEDAVQTSRFESQRIDEEEFFTTDQSSSDIEFNLDRSYREWDARFRLLAEKEKQVAQRELKTIIQEKHLLNRTRSQMLVSPNKENSTTSINSYDLYCQQLNATYNNKEQTFKKKMGHLKGKINENQQMNYIPIQQRAQLLIQEKQQKIAEQQRLKELREDQEFSKLTFQPNAGRDREHRTVDKFLKEVDYWIERKNEYIQQMQNEKYQQEEKELTFKPQINKKSQRMIQDQNISIQDRSQRSMMHKQITERKHLIEEMKKTPFHPQLSQITPERSKSPNTQRCLTSRNGRSITKTPQAQRIQTQVTPIKYSELQQIHKHNKSIISTADNSNNNSKRTVLPLQNMTNHMQFIVDLINKPQGNQMF